MKRPRASPPAARSLRRRATVLILAVAVLAVLSYPDAARASCRERDAALRQLAEKYGEAPVAVALANSGQLVEVLASKDGATWSILVTAPGGPTCLVSAGEAWRPLQPKAPEGPGT